MGNKFSSSSADAADHSDVEEVTKTDASRDRPQGLSSSHKEIVIDCFMKSREDTTQRIIMRMMQQREDFRDFIDDLDSGLRSNFSLFLKNYLEEAIENIDDPDKVKSLSSEFGAFHVLLKWCGFKPDFFVAMANAIATECAFLSDTSTGSTATFRAWTLLVEFMFSAVRDGYYRELRHRRRMSPHLLAFHRSSSDLKSLDGDQPVPKCASSVNLVSDGLREGTELSRVRREKESRSPSAGGSPSSGRQGRTLRRGAAFYIRDWPETYKARSRSAFTLKTDSDSLELDRPGMQKLKMAAFSQYKETLSMSTASQTPGRYQKNVSISEDQKKRFARRQGISNQKNASSSSLFDPNKIIDDFMHDRL